MTSGRSRRSVTPPPPWGCSLSRATEHQTIRLILDTRLSPISAANLAASHVQDDEPDRVDVSIARDATRSVKRWRDGKIALRWIAAGMLEAEKQFRKVDGHRDLHVLKHALERHQEVIEGRSKVA